MWQEQLRYHVPPGCYCAEPPQNSCQNLDFEVCQRIDMCEFPVLNLVVWDASANQVLKAVFYFTRLLFWQPHPLDVLHVFEPKLSKTY